MAKEITRFDERALLVKLTISEWSATKTDVKATSEVIQTHNAQASAGKFQKKLLVSNALMNFKNNAQTARQLHYAMTLPWMDEGLRILPTKMYRKYMDKMHPFKVNAEAAADKFCDEYLQSKEEAKAHLGTMWNDADYPDVTSIREKFRFDIEPRPIPQSEDWRVDLDEKILSDIREQTENSLLLAQKEAVRDVYVRLEKRVSHMAEFLSDPNRILQHSLLFKMQELLEVVPHLNITDDPNIDDIVERISNTICTLDINDLRKDDVARSKAAEEATVLLGDIQTLAKA